MRLYNADNCDIHGDDDDDDDLLTKSALGL